MPENPIVFFGDSITDAGRREDPDGLGQGYVRLIAEALPGRTVLNRGISGNRARDLLARVDADVVVESPALVSIMIGINDTWRRYDSDDPTTVEEFERDYRATLDELRATDAELVILEPFVLPVPPDRAGWREDLDPKIDAARRLADEFGALLLHTDALFTELAGQHPAVDLLPDGVHPSPLGHRAIADLWLANVPH